MKILKSFLTFGLFFSSLFLSVYAQSNLPELNDGKNTSVSSEQEKSQKTSSFESSKKLSYISSSDNLYNIGESFSTDRVIDGEVYVLAKNIILNKNIKDSVACIGNNVSISNNIDGNLRLFAKNASIYESKIKKDVYLFGNEIIIKDTSVDGEINLGGSSILIKNIESKEIKISADTISLEGEIKGDLILESNNIEISENAKIIGNLVYKSAKEVSKISNYVDGKVEHQKISLSESDLENSFSFSFLKSWKFFVYILILIGLYFLFKKRLELISKIVRENPGKSFFYGLFYYGTLILLPIILFMTVVLIPLSLVLWLLLIISILITKILVSLSLTRLVSDISSSKVSGKKLIALEILTIIILSIVFKTFPQTTFLLSLFVRGTIFIMIFYGKKYNK